MKTKERIQISKAIYNELEKFPRWRILFALQDGEKKVYDLTKKFGWKKTCIHTYIRSLEKSKSIKSRIVVENNRAVKYIKLRDNATYTASRPKENDKK